MKKTLSPLGTTPSPSQKHVIHLFLSETSLKTVKSSEKTFCPILPESREVPFFIFSRDKHSRSKEVYP